MEEHQKPGVTNVDFEDQNVWNHFSDKHHLNHSYLNRFMVHLAVCHTVMVEPSKDGSISYNA